MKRYKLKFLAEKCPIKRKDCNMCEYSGLIEQNKINCLYSDVQKLKQKYTQNTKL